MMVVGVLVELSNKNIDRVFDYVVPSHLEKSIKIGIRVTVPFNHQVLEGFVLEIKEGEERNSNLKEVINIVDSDVVLNEELLNLGKYMQEKTLSTLISCYQVMLPKALKAKAKASVNVKYEKNIKLGMDIFNISDYKLTSKQLEMVNYVVEKKEVLKSTLSKISASILKKLLDKGIFVEIDKEVYRLVDNKQYSISKYDLTSDQQKVVDIILNSKELPKTYLLHGVTGSGKTEVYMELIEYMLKNDRSSIVLVPEISLTPQMVNRFKSRFDSSIAILHSRLSDGEKYDEYRRISRGEVKIVIGARSAVFAPLKDIGLFVIDEEHTSSYKQDNNPKYNAIDIAIERSKTHKGIVVLGSATPTLESYAKSLKGLYSLVELPNRVNNRPLPEVKIIDMNKGKRKGEHFSKELIDAIQERLDRKEQIILLLNRRGYSSFITCSNCGYVEKCPSCDITLTYHKSSNMLRCHYCGYATKHSEICPECREESVKNLGIGTEKIEEELHKLFDAKIIRMDFDTTTKKGAHEKIINEFKEQEYDILLGTQMIAKGLDFENVTLVGVINADTSLMIPNYKSSEDTFDLLCQVSGRAGRGQIPGEVIIQTFNKEHYAINLAKSHDYKSFFKEEMNIRRKLGYPPYYYLVTIKIISPVYELARDHSNKVANILKEKLNSSIVLGPSVSNIFKLNNTYRFSIIIKYKKEEKLHEALEQIIDYYKTNSKVKIDITFE
ncbi:MAG: primosomal protein N' [Bacilli bacterium]|nr:primosomal protein N' [Bacilli bacterium]